MKVFRAIEWKGGWFAGDFEPAAYRTKDFEVCLKRHPKGEKWPAHYHKVATEINYLIRGTMTLRGEKFTAGDVFVLEPGEIADPEFLEDSEMIVIKAPSAKNDKYVTEK
jgi:quercetin dioxygenase-like cupin family protein